MNRLRKIVITIFVGLSIVLSSCGPQETPKTSTVSEIETVEDSSASNDFRLIISDDQTVPICQPSLYALLEKQKNYDVNDYSYTVKDASDYGSNTDGAIISWGYENPDNVKEVIVKFADNEALTDSISIKASKPTKRSKEGSVCVPNLYTNTTYYYQIVVTMKDSTTVKSDVLSFTTVGPRVMTVAGIKNMRDLGGWTTTSGQTIRQGLIYRTAKPNDLTPAGQYYMIEDLKIRTELDLRNPKSESDAPVESPLQDRLNYINISGVSYLSVWENPKRISEEFDVFLHEENYPIFFHCAAGADRTGCLAYLIEALLGVDENYLIADYEITPNRYRIGSTDDEGRIYDMVSFVSVLKKLPGETLQEKARYYLVESCGISNASLDWFIDFMLEKK